MSSDVEIKIFGKVSNPETIFELAVAAAGEGKIGWLTAFRADEFPGLLEQAAREGRALELTRRNTTDYFEGVRSSCQAAGLSYVLSCGETGAEGFTNGFAWHPGMTREFEFLLAGKNAVLQVADVQKAVSQGIGAVNALVERIANNTRVGKVEIEPGFLEAYQAYAGSQETYKPSFAGSRI